MNKSNIKSIVLILTILVTSICGLTAMSTTASAEGRGNYFYTSYPYNYVSDNNQYRNFPMQNNYVPNNYTYNNYNNSYRYDGGENNNFYPNIGRGHFATGGFIDSGYGGNNNNFYPNIGGGRNGVGGSIVSGGHY